MRFARILTRIAAGIAVALATAIPARAQSDDPFSPGNASKAGGGAFEQAIPKISAQIEPPELKRGQIGTLKVSLEIAPGWHTYPTRQTDPGADSQITQISTGASTDLIFTGEFIDPPFLAKPELAAGIKDLHYYENRVVFERPLKIKPDAAPGKKTLKVTLTVIVCNDAGCLPPEKVEREATYTVADGTFVAENTPPAAQPIQDRGPDTTASKPPSSQPSGVATEAKKANVGFWVFLLQAVGWGAISLITPCVFPMIPITVSFFLKQSEKAHHRPFGMALAYSGTIVTVLTIGGLILMKSLQNFSQHPATNFFLGALFLVFALSLFGMFEIRLPTSLATFTSAQEGRGGLLGVVFMALTFTIISFTCVAPFYGSFIAFAASAQSASDWVQLFFGALAFSATFASPFFLLALFPTLLRSLPKSGSWMNTMKVVMGFLEVAAALKFLRAGELLVRDQAQFLTYDLVLGCYVALAFLCGLYLLNVYRLPHDHDVPEQLGVPRLVLSLIFLTLGLYLMPALFKQGDGAQQRPRGAVFAWLDSFLLPDASDNEATTVAGSKPQLPGDTARSPGAGVNGGSGAEGKNVSHLPWTGNLQRGLQDAFDKRKLVFIDFTGKT
jgi:cytochrome c biogenesis protein CcdA